MYHLTVLPSTAKSEHANFESRFDSRIYVSPRHVCLCHCVPLWAYVGIGCVMMDLDEYCVWCPVHYQFNSHGCPGGLATKTKSFQKESGENHRQRVCCDTEVIRLLPPVCRACQSWCGEKRGRDSMWSLLVMHLPYYSIFVTWTGCGLILAMTHQKGREGGEWQIKQDGGRESTGKRGCLLWL